MTVSRNIFQQPFGVNSIWNTALGKGGGGLVSAGTGPHGGAEMKYSDNTGPVYEFAGVTTSATSVVCDENLILLGPNSPLQVVHTNTFGWSGNPAAPARCAATQTATGTSVPVPTNASYPGLDGDLVTNACTQPAVYGGEPNCAAAILLADRVTLYQQQPMQICTTGGPPTTEFFFSPNVSITADETSTPPSAYGSHGGSAMSALGGTIRYNELIPGNCPFVPGVADVMRHALSCAFEQGLFAAFTTGFVWPASNSDSGAEGLLLALLPTFNINSLLSTPGKSVAWTIMNYGMYINDSNPAGPFGDAFNINPEYSYGDSSVNCPTGRVMCQFSTVWGTFMSPSPSTASTWGEDLITICQNLYVVTNNAPSAIGGGAGSSGRLQPAAVAATDPGVITVSPVITDPHLSMSVHGLSAGQSVGQVTATQSPYQWSLSGTGATNFWIQPTTGLIYVATAGVTGIVEGVYTLTASATNIHGTATGTVTIKVYGSGGMGTNRGMNFSGGENIPANYQTNIALYNWAATQNFGTIRLCFLMSHLTQVGTGPSQLYANFNAGDINSLQTCAENCRVHGQWIKLDDHSYGGILNPFPTGTTDDATFLTWGADVRSPASAWADCWARLCSLFANYTYQVGMMNECMGDVPSNTLWRANATACTAVIRTIAPTVLIELPSAPNTPSLQTAVWTGYTDTGPFRFGVHQYYDNAGGTLNTCTATTPAAYWGGITTWALANGYQVSVSEWAVGTAVSCIPTLCNDILNYFNTNVAVYPDWQWWGGGDFPTSYMFYMGVEPGGGNPAQYTELAPFLP